MQNGTTEMRALEQVGFGQAYDNPSLYCDRGRRRRRASPSGEIGAIYLSTDGGQTWTRQDSSDKASGRSGSARVSLVPGSDGAIVGADGARVRIVDGQRRSSRDGGTRAAEAVH